MIPGVNPNQPYPTPVGLEATLFPQNSRYHGVPVRTVRHNGKEIAYLERRMIPPDDELEEIRLHTVVEGDRLDNLANQYFGDPEQFWRICDANAALDPAEMTATIGRRLRITLPEGVPGAPRA